METITRSRAAEMIRKLEDGHFFSVTFVKRTTGELRTMNCRQRVTKHLKGGEAAYSFSEKGLVSVYDLQNNGYRSFPIDSLMELRAGGVTYSVTEG